MFELPSWWLAETAPLAGRLAFAGVFAAVIVWLMVIPSSHLTEEDQSPAWWRRSRVWAVMVAATQMLIYLLWS